VSAWERATWRTDGALYRETEEGRFFVMRHGEGRKYWGVQYPDGTYTHSALTKAEAKQQAEAWQRDPSLTTLAGSQSANPDTELQGATESVSTDVSPAAAVVSAFVDALSSREFKRAQKGWDQRTAGDAQQRALGILRELAALRAAVDEAILDQVAKARKNTGSDWYPNSATWADVGAALGVTKQSAQARFGKYYA
jgi:hypothetical protein